jgi:ribonuclease PH
MRPIRVVRGFTKFAAGSCLFCMGDTHVLCNATFQQGQPPHLAGTAAGWITAEYAMLPQSGDRRNSRQQMLNNGRTKEISRIIGRSLRMAADLEHMGPFTVTVDCDVLQADGGTRTASINGAFIAMHDLFTHMLRRKLLTQMPIRTHIAAISAGFVEGRAVVDLCKDEDNNADADMTLVINDRREIVELAFTAEKSSPSMDAVAGLVGRATKDALRIIAFHKRLLASGRRTARL